MSPARLVAMMSPCLTLLAEHCAPWLRGHPAPPNEEQYRARVRARAGTGSPGTRAEPERGAGKQLGPVRLYFGCRHQAQDFIYRSELEAWRQQGTLQALSTAFSRDGPQKDYVQVLLTLPCDQPTSTCRSCGVAGTRA